MQEGVNFSLYAAWNAFAIQEDERPMRLLPNSTSTKKMARQQRAEAMQKAFK
jgi:hypothetical protein